MAYIFISYSRKDQDYATQLADDLTKRGFDAWIDNRNIDFGDDWFNEIEKSIIGCSAFIILMSPESKESHWVKREVLLAYKQKKSIFPLLLEGEEFPILIELQFADVRDVKLPPDSFYARLAKVVQPKDSTGQIIVHRPKPQPNPRDSRRLRGLIGVIVLAILIAAIGIVLSGALGGDDNKGGSRLGFGRVYQNETWTTHEDVINGATMVLVPVGCFMMGSEDGEDDEKPVIEQCFDAPFWIDKYEVTRGDYASCVAAGVCTETPDDDDSTRNTQPINRVTWFQAAAYCEWREARLPTEKEWEYAARGPSNWEYPWGDDFVADNVAYSSNSNRVIADVGSRPYGQSWVGAMDMSGNVWEWVSSRYLTYPYEPIKAEDNNYNYRVARGGSSLFSDDDLRALNRFRIDRHQEFEFIGFRCVRSH